jgi:myb-related protein
LKKNWTDDDRKVLIWLIGKYMAFFKRDFKLIVISDFMLERSRLEQNILNDVEKGWVLV